MASNAEMFPFGDVIMNILPSKQTQKSDFDILVQSKTSAYYHYDTYINMGHIPK